MKVIKAPHNSLSMGKVSALGMCKVINQDGAVINIYLHVMRLLILWHMYFQEKHGDVCDMVMMEKKNHMQIKESFLLVMIKKLLETMIQRRCSILKPLITLLLFLIFLPFIVFDFPLVGIVKKI